MWAFFFVLCELYYFYEKKQKEKKLQNVDVH